MLEGRNVNLEPAKDDVSLLVRWWRDSQYMGEYQDVKNYSEGELQRIMLYPDMKFFVIRKKDGTKVGHINAWMLGKMREIGFALVPIERGKGYATEAIKLIVNLLYKTEDIVRIQASTDAKNISAKKALERVGFRNEGTMRKSGHVQGEYRDQHLYSILRREWKEPKIQTKTA